MKMKLFALSLLSLAGLALSESSADAWWLRHNHGINRFSTVVVCRPYNAFTPVCAGSLVCDGFCPFSAPTMPCHGASCSPLLGNPMLPLAQMDQSYQLPTQQTWAPSPYQVPAQQTWAPNPYQVQAQPTNFQPHYPMYYQPWGAHNTNVGYQR